MSSDFDDTVLRPPQSVPSPATDAVPDVEDTLPAGSIPIPPTGPVPIEPPKITTAPIEVVVDETGEQDGVEPDDLMDAAAGATIDAPVPLIEPPAPPRHSAAGGVTPPPLAGTAIPDVSDNIWSEPLPEKPRPFRLLLDDGTLVPLDQPVYLGRRPSVPRIHPGGVPLLVTMDSPQREVSSTHLELTTVGGAIVATDLKSTNGSVLRLPGAEPRTLVAGASAVVTPGTVIELGDGNTIELLAPDYEGDE